MKEESKTIPQLSVDTQILAKHLLTVEEGDTIKYETLSALIKADVQRKARHLLAGAQRLVQRENEVVFEAVRGVGLKRLASPEIASVGRAAIGKIHRTARRGLKKMACAKYDEMTNDDRVKHNATVSVLGALGQAAKPKYLVQIEDAAKKANDKLSFNKTLELFQV